MPSVEIETTVEFTSIINSTPDVLNSVDPIELMVDIVDIRKKFFCKNQYHNISMFQVQTRKWVSMSPYEFNTGASLPNGKYINQKDTSNNWYVTTFSGRTDFPEKVIVETGDITIDILDTADYVYITGSGAAVGLIPFWS